MSNKTIVGQLKGKRNPMTIEWEIADFLSLSAEVDKCYRSRIFYFCNSSWYIQLYPNGRKCKSSEGFIGLYINRGDSGPPVSVTYSFFIKKTDGREDIVNDDKQTFDEKDNGWGAPKAIGRSEVINRESEFLPSGIFNVVCCLKCDETQIDEASDILKSATKDCTVRTDASCQTDTDIGTKKLLNDLEGLVINGNGSDVTIQVQDEEFQLHKNILAARSLVFSSMFSLNMKEKATGVVSIEDCEAGPFRTFVHYLYTGSIDQITSENVFSLFKIADKYQVLELKTSCLDIMKNILSVDTFCGVVDLAMKYDIEDLMEVATDFLSKNTIDIIDTKEWQTLLINNFRVVNGLLKKALIHKEDK